MIFTTPPLTPFVSRMNGVCDGYQTKNALRVICGSGSYFGLTRTRVNDSGAEYNCR